MSDWTLPPSGDRRGGMYIKTAIGTVVLGCGLGGLVLATILAIAWSGVDRRARELSHDAAAIVDLRRLDDELAEWATKVDLVLASGQTWFIDDLKRASARMHALLERMEWDALTTGFTTRLWRLESRGTRSCSGISKPRIRSSHRWSIDFIRWMQRFRR